MDLSMKTLDMNSFCWFSTVILTFFKCLLLSCGLFLHK